MKPAAPDLNDCNRTTVLIRTPSGQDLVEVRAELQWIIGSEEQGFALELAGREPAAPTALINAPALPRSLFDPTYYS